MSIRIYDAEDNSVSFTSAEATDTGTVQPYYSILRGAEESAGGNIMQQIRPGKRFNKNYELNVAVAKYLSFMNLITNQANDYYIEFTTVPEILDNDPEITTTNNFRVSITVDNVKSTVGATTVFKFNLQLQSVVLL